MMPYAPDNPAKMVCGNALNPRNDMDSEELNGHVFGDTIYLVVAEDCESCYYRPIFWTYDQEDAQNWIDAHETKHNAFSLHQIKQLLEW